MTTLRIATWFSRKLAELKQCQRGNVAMIFGLALIPIVGLVGVAIDYSRANSAKTSLQSALDAAALMLSREVSSLSQSELNQKALAYVQANLNRTDLKGLTVTPTFTNTSGGELKLRGQASIDTTITSILGVEQMNIADNSTIKWGNTKLRVALVLDTTGSMNSAGKMPALKTAAKNLLTQLESAASNNGDVYVSIVPFSKNVNVGKSNYNAGWIDWTDWEAEPAILDTAKSGAKPANWAQLGPNSTCPFNTQSTYGFRCVFTAHSTSNVTTIPSSGLICPGRDGGQKSSVLIGNIYNGCYTSVVTEGNSTGSSAACPSNTDSYLSGTNGTTDTCSCRGGGRNKNCTWNFYEHVWRGSAAAAPARSTWNGCVTDRGTSSGPSNDYDRKVDAPNFNIAASKFSANQYYNCSPQVTALNYNWNSMKSAVDTLYPDGATNQPIGMVHGWQSLVGGGPFPNPPAKDPNFIYNEVIVLMSDGLNTLDRWYGNGSSTSTSVDKRMYESATVGTCANVKAAGVTIYAVHVNTDSDSLSTLLRNCASSPDKFWMVTSGTALNDVFNQIGTELSQLRIAK